MRRICVILAVAGFCACVREAAVPFPGELRGGDLLFRRGRGSKTRAVLAVDSAGLYSHVGLVCDTDSGLVVVHAVPGESVGRDVVKAERPCEFFATGRAASGAVCRLKEMEEDSLRAFAADRDNILRVAACYALRARAAGTEFDHDYDLEDSSRVYCTELVWRAFMAAGVDLSEGRRTRVQVPSFEGDYIMPSDLYRCAMLDEISTYPKQ